jgi:hypothetical protein
VRIFFVFLFFQQFLLAVIDRDFVDRLPIGWHIVGTDSKVEDFSIFSEVEIVWSYKGTEWSAFSHRGEMATKISNEASVKNLLSIPEHQGFWLKIDKQVPVMNALNLVGGEGILSFNLNISNGLGDSLEINIFDGNSNIYSGSNLSGSLLLDTGDHEITVCSKNGDGERCKTETVSVLPPSNPYPELIAKVDNLVFVNGVEVETNFQHSFSDTEELDYSLDCQLPTGLTLSSDGTLSGQSTDSSETICRVIATDSIQQSIESNYFSISTLTVSEIGTQLLPYFTSGTYVNFLDEDESGTISSGDEIANCYTTKLNVNPESAGLVSSSKIYIQDRGTEICSGVEAESEIQYLCFREEYPTKEINSPSASCENGLIFGYVKIKLFDDDKILVDFENVVKEYRKGEL